ncbi:trypsin-like serine protease [Dechloromonas denitrificans]|uniref:trypsin-like serine protease n=1 Tax=Dechloromonas denitrificans TaxID=281362 RepID=UPI001CFBAD5C|nr:trypsin-like serine protease [Dechloromonas denitrificans]UCV07025.1 trypsin-like serine protease [Dechloromonas denitrificans]
MNRPAQTTLALLLMALPGIGSAQKPNDDSQQQKVIIFRPVMELIPPGRVKLANGIEVDRKDWPTLVLADIQIPDSDKPGTCTGTLVGPNVILLAAHCVDTQQGKPIPAQLWIESRRIPMVCEMHPAYLKSDYRPSMPRNSEDFALCMLNDGGKQPVPIAKMSFEVIDIQTALNPGEVVLMTGYGCSALKILPEGGLTRSFDRGSLRIGIETIDSTLGKWKNDPAYATIRSKEGKEPAVCPGDSGGPLFSGVTVAAPSGARRVRGVNSSLCTVRRGDTAMCASSTIGSGTWDIISAIAATGFPSFRLWVEDWIARNKDRAPIVCGINRQARETPCRD